MALRSASKSEKFRTLQESNPGHLSLELTLLTTRARLAILESHGWELYGQTHKR